MTPGLDGGPEPNSNVGIELSGSFRLRPERELFVVAAGAGTDGVGETARIAAVGTGLTAAVLAGTLASSFALGTHAVRALRIANTNTWLVKLAHRVVVIVFGLSFIQSWDFQPLP